MMDDGKSDEDEEVNSSHLQGPTFPPAVCLGWE